MVRAVTQMVTARTPKAKFIRMLKCAHSSELGAFFAYEGHVKSLKSPEERKALLKIQNDEWNHVLTLRCILTSLGEKPSPVLDLTFIAIGKIAGALCHVTGYYWPMKGAMLLETAGFDGYKRLAGLAHDAGHRYLVDEFLSMAYAEFVHEEYFRGRL